MRVKDLRCPHCWKRVSVVEGSNQFVHVNVSDYFWCGKIPTYAVERLSDE
jgi:hypothetical protein